MIRDHSEGGASSSGVWNSGTGSWNSTLETTGMVLLALAAVGYDCNDERLSTARVYLLSQREQWTAPGQELDGALAIQAFLDTGGEWDEVASAAQSLSKWAKGAAFWQHATRSAKESLDQSCRVAQIASHLINIGWTAIRSDLPAFIDALKTPDLFRNEFRNTGSKEALNSSPQRTLVIESQMHDVELETIKVIDKISLNECSVVGAYRRFDERVRNQLKDWKIHIEKPLDVSTLTRENFLIWAAPGSGKSFFIQEIARSIGDKVRYFEINLAKLCKEDFTRLLHEVNECKLPILCLLDEIDSRADETWPYEICFSMLDLNLQESRDAVFVLVGSFPTGMEGMIRSIKSRNKGQDLVDRIPVNNRFEIPGLSIEDQLIVVASQIVESAEARGQSVKEVEKLALYYTIKNKELRTPRQLREIAVGATYRMRESDDRLKYDDLFDRGDNRNQRFWVDHHDAAAELSNVYIKIDV